MSESVKQVMSKKLVTIDFGSTIAEAEQLMNERRIRHLPVVDTLGRILGILSHRDVSRVMNSNHLPVEKVMQTHLELIDTDAGLRSAALKMLEHKISCLLVVDETNDVVGIVTTDDMLWCLVEMLHKEEQEETSTYARFKDRAVQTIGDLANRVANIGI